jgi:hypothetical protein
VKPGFRPAAKNQNVIYLGPQATIEDDFGNRLTRGQPTLLNIHDWQALKKSGASCALIESEVQPIVCGSHRIDL